MQTTDPRRTPRPDSDAHTPKPDAVSYTHLTLPTNSRV